jgi:hypothetical protein
MVEHFTVNHEHCPGYHQNLRMSISPPVKEAAQDQLRDFLAHTAELLRHTRNNLTTEFYESFNSVKAVYVNKTISWRVSWPTRIMCAILRLNSPEIWRLELYLACGLSRLHPDTLAHLRNETLRHMQRTDHRRTQFKQERQTKKRIAARNTVLKDTKGKNNHYLLHEDLTSRDKK